jgi:hypothetical protein
MRSARRSVQPCDNCLCRLTFSRLRKSLSKVGVLELNLSSLTASTLCPRMTRRPQSTLKAIENLGHGVGVQNNEVCGQHCNKSLIVGFFICLLSKPKRCISLQPRARILWQRHDAEFRFAIHRHQLCTDTRIAQPHTRFTSHIPLDGPVSFVDERRCQANVLVEVGCDIPGIGCSGEPNSALLVRFAFALVKTLEPGFDEVSSLFVHGFNVDPVLRGRRPHHKPNSTTSRFSGLTLRFGVVAIAWDELEVAL